jgi:hypothetical protein
MSKYLKILNTVGHLILLLLAAYKLQAQQPRISGYVTEMNSGKKRVPNVIVKAAVPARTQPVNSLSDGSFTLIFQDMAAGQHVYIQAEKPGWLVINEKEMRAVIPDVNGSSSHIIVMCPAKKLEKLRKEYYHITDFYITRQYKRELDSLKRIKKDYQQEAMALNDKFMALRKQLDTIAAEYSRTNLDDVTEVERRAINAFKAGNIYESIRLRDSLQSGKVLPGVIIEKKRNDSLQKTLKQNSNQLGNIHNLKPVNNGLPYWPPHYVNTRLNTELWWIVQHNYPVTYSTVSKPICRRRNGWLLYCKLLNAYGVC